MWRIPTDKLVEHGYLRTATQVGKQGINVYKSKERQGKRGCGSGTWTAAYYKGVQPLDDAFPPAAEAAAGHLLDDLRTGRVV